MILLVLFYILCIPSLWLSKPQFEQIEQIILEVETILEINVFCPVII